MKLRTVKHVVRYLFKRRYRTYCKAHEIVEALHARRTQ